MLQPSCQTMKVILFFIYSCCYLLLVQGSKTIPNGLQPIRVTSDFTQIEKSYVNSEQKQHIILIINLFSQFLSQLLYVKPRESKIKNDGFLYCRDTYIGQNGIDGYSNSDLVLVVSATNLILDDFRVNYEFCKWDNKPIMMQIRFQMRQFVKYPVNYEISQLKRSFMYNGMWNTNNFNYWIDDSTGKTYEQTSQIYQQLQVQGVQKYFLTGKYIKKAVQTHFNCPTAIGLEVQSDEIMSNLIPDDLYNDEQTRDYPNRLFSQFDVAIIKDMGVYEYVNDDFAENIEWGKNQGCSFLENTCQNIFQQTIEVQGQLYQCTQFKNSKFIKSKQDIQSQFENGQCPRLTQTNSISCLDSTQSNQFTTYFGEIYGIFSKCIESNVQNKQNIINSYIIQSYQYKDSPIRCHHVQCVQDYIIIYFSLNQRVICEKPNSVIQVDTQDFIGQLKCPSDFSVYCSQKFCLNDCSGAGFCNNGICICIQGRYGIDCSLVCENGQNDCQCQYPCSQCQNSKDKCVSCVSGYKLAFNQNKCEIICHKSCLECRSPLDPFSCTSCDVGLVLVNGQCKPCNEPCKKCITNPDICTQCIENYSLNTNMMKCLPNCYKSCKSCLHPLTQNSCLSCFDGYYLTSQMTCEKFAHLASKDIFQAKVGLAVDVQKGIILQKENVFNARQISILIKIFKIAQTVTNLVFSALEVLLTNVLYVTAKNISIQTQKLINASVLMKKDQ
ncbi:leishmanolysin family protein (macronuclear) [Tetrahymena thermophila SB210]|uniref:Leishmanolysin family protein n=1 Tax=Tetrahymena thermophila (strain SB210) TaxID=312017 RepID=I7M1J4_TETTS|nr:leishmanolysin family protein [Tetrahymena thermophila SB210]EAR96458.2 leishmanolysin family protein [Tetrahymena thermophila SB210]|eukprot:XP_001016703.2 leishmanolysin family protein [Tetrahymena thermophila SB210]